MANKKALSLEEEIAYKICKALKIKRIEAVFLRNGKLRVPYVNTDRPRAAIFVSVMGSGEIIVHTERSLGGKYTRTFSLADPSCLEKVVDFLFKESVICLQSFSSDAGYAEGA